MTDTATKKRLIVEGCGGEKPLLSLPFTQVPDVQRVFDAAGVRYELAEHVISWDDGPEMALIIFRLGTDGRAVQKLLDSAD